MSHRPKWLATSVGTVALAALLTACGTPRSLPRPGASPPAATPVTAAVSTGNGAAQAVLAGLPIYPGAQPSAARVPLAIGTPGSSYLQSASATYQADATSATIAAWYDEALKSLGWRPFTTGGSYTRGRETEYARSWTKGPSRLLQAGLSLLPTNGGKTVYLVTVQDIVVPPRPAASLAPQSATAVVIRWRQNVNSPWERHVVTARADVAVWVKTINALGLAPTGTAPHGCAMDNGERATFQFRLAGKESGVFTLNPACVSLLAPDGSDLAATNLIQKVQLLFTGR